MLKLNRITFAPLLYQILAKEGIYRNILGVEDLISWSPDFLTTAWFEAEYDGKTAGIFAVKQETQSLHSFHAGVYKEYHGRAFFMLRNALRIMKKEYPGIRFMTTIAGNRTNIAKAHELMGLELIGRIKKGCGNEDMIIFAEKE